MLHRFLATNRKACGRIQPYLPQAKKNIFVLYEEIVARHMNARAGQIVVDVGGGKSCKFARYRDPASGTKIIAVDVSEEDLNHNTDVDETRVADIMRDLPFDSEEADLLVSRSVLEHLEDLDSFVVNSERVLKRQGYSIHVFPSRFAPFALINRALPNFLGKKVLHFFISGSEGIQGFPAFYDDCYYSGIKGLLERRGFDVVDTRLGYYQSPYFNFFLPLFLTSAAYEMLVRALGIKNLAAYVLVVARKR